MKTSSCLLLQKTLQDEGWFFAYHKSPKTALRVCLLLSLLTCTLLSLHVLKLRVPELTKPLKTSGIWHRLFPYNTHPTSLWTLIHSPRTNSSIPLPLEALADTPSLHPNRANHLQALVQMTQYHNPLIMHFLQGSSSLSFIHLSIPRDNSPWKHLNKWL